MDDLESILDDLVDRWTFEGEGPESLQRFLGMTDAQYRYWQNTALVPDGWEPNA